MSATKDQERKALEKIRKIVEELGENSYVGTALEGCFEIAEENIDNDFACSMKQRAEAAEKKALTYKEAADNSAISAKNATSAEAKAYERIKELEKQLLNVKEISSKNNEQAINNWNKFREQEERADALEQEIIKLKAKLYDLICN